MNAKMALVINAYAASRIRHPKYGEIYQAAFRNVMDTLPLVVSEE